MDVTASCSNQGIYLIISNQNTPLLNPSNDEWGPILTGTESERYYRVSHIYQPYGDAPGTFRGEVEAKARRPVIIMLRLDSWLLTYLTGHIVGVGCGGVR